MPVLPLVVGIAARAVGAIAGRGLLARGMSQGTAKMGEAFVRGGSEAFGNQMVQNMQTRQGRTQRATM